ncbi:hypothetical protein BGW39_009661, partial [Mortierella sp. 14UC]
SSWYLQKKWDSVKAQKSVVDLGIKSVLRLAGGSEGRKIGTAKGPPPILAIGLGAFNTRTGLSSKHSRLEKAFIQKDTKWWVVWNTSLAPDAQGPHAQDSSETWDTDLVTASLVVFLLTETKQVRKASHIV